MSDLRDELILAMARADGQDWTTLDDAPTRGEFMGYPQMADAALTIIAGHLGSFAVAELVERGGKSPRGAALWDASVYLDTLHRNRDSS